MTPRYVDFFELLLNPGLQNVSYTWQDGSHETAYHINEAGVYSLTVANACGSSSDDISVTVLPDLNFPQDTTFCDTSTWLVDVTFINSVYQWSDGLTLPKREITKSGTYWIRVANTCDTVTDTFNVHVDLRETIEIEDTYVLCGLSGDYLTLKANLNKPVVQWSTGVTTTQLNVQDTGIYWGTISNTCGISSDTTHVLLWDTAYRFDLGNDTVVCDENATIELAWEDSIYPLAYAWTNGQNSSSINAGVGVHMLDISNRCATLNDHVQIRLADPVFILDIGKTDICGNEVVEAQLSRTSYANALWSTGAKSNSIAIEAPGQYFVSVTDTNNCLFIDTLTIGDNCPAEVFASNVFTPNDDGINDQYCFRFDNAKSIEAFIFNRWGVQVYHSSYLDECWDGSFNEKPQEEGTYFYMVTIKDNKENSTYFQGSLTLLR